MTHRVCDTWGRVTEDERRARQRMKIFIRLCYLFRPPYGEETIRQASDESKELVTEATPLSEAYVLLDAEQRTRLRDDVENPAVTMHLADGTIMFMEADLHLLARLEGGQHVGSIIETQVRRKAGDRAF